MTKLLNQWLKDLPGGKRSRALSFPAASPLLHAQRDPWPLDQHRRHLGLTKC
ncbi:MAG: hypothetical protein CM1200mP25_2080 [Acidobacteriota bacterium]|nr:MAG: hypothetical protein CM1200mP25_2080 [Acidobacteriota bacterium]